MKLDVPYYSQFKDIQNPELKQKGCSIACLAMAINYFRPEEINSLDNLFEEGIQIGGISLHGWKHTSIAILAHNHGVEAYCEEFRSVHVDIKNKKFLESEHKDFFTNTGVMKIKNFLENNGLVMASILPGLSSGKSVHTVLLAGFEEENGELRGFYYHDPDSQDASRKEVFISLRDFLKFWRNMAIFIGETSA